MVAAASISGKEKSSKAPLKNKKGKANLIDLHVGTQVRQRRLILGLSQQDLAEKVQVTFQQIQKYESGSNRISAGRLHQLSGILGVPIAFFFDGYVEPKSGSKSGAASKNSDGTPADVAGARETIDLLRIYYMIENEELRKKLLTFTKELASTLKDR